MNDRSHRRPSSRVGEERSEFFVSIAAKQIYWDRVAQWAKDDTAEFPSETQIRAELERELDVLNNWLGDWSLVDPDQVFPQQPCTGSCCNPDYRDF